MYHACRYGLVVSLSASHAVGHRFASRLGHTKDHHKNGTNCLLNIIIDNIRETPAVIMMYKCHLVCNRGVNK